MKRRAKEIESQFHKLEGKYSTGKIHVEGKLEPEIETELRQKAYVIEYSVESLAGDVRDFTYISLPDDKPAKRNVNSQGK